MEKVCPVFLLCSVVWFLVGIELIFLPVAVVFWIQYEKNVDNTDILSCCYEIKDVFPSFLFSANEQVCRSWEGA